MAKEFEIGDVVQLKSGGPRMTVTKAEREAAHGGTITCVWFTREQIPVRSEFWGALLSHQTAYFQDPGT
jgi:uncharacterized protein YodC (DUF2158 family)